MSSEGEMKMPYWTPAGIVMDEPPPGYVAAMDDETKEKDKPVTLTGPQADLCRVVLAQELMKVYQQLTRDHNATAV